MKIKSTRTNVKHQLPECTAYQVNVKRKLVLVQMKRYLKLVNLCKLYPEPYWILPIQGKSIRLSTKQLYQQQLLGEQLLNYDIVWRPLKPTKRDPDPYRDWLMS